MRILSVNVGTSRPVTVKHQTVQTGIYKTPVTRPVTVSRFGLQDDVRIETRKMGLEHSAVYAYPFEHYAYWQQELACEPFPTGQFGENLTVTGLMEDEVRIGDIFRFGDTILQVAHPRIPCGKLNARMGFRFSTRFLQSGKVGYYLRVLKEGNVATDDSIELLERDEASPTMEEFVRVVHYEYWDEKALQNLLQARDLMPAWRETIEGKLARTQAACGWHGLREFEITGRQQESQNTVSFYLECVRGRPLAPFHGGQQLMVGLGGRGGGSQQRWPCYISGNPQNLSNYRVTLRHKVVDNESGSDDSLTSVLIALKVGDRILCNAPHGAAKATLQQDRITVLISEGAGIAAILSLLYELEAQQARVILIHVSTDDEPQELLREVNDLIKRNASWQVSQVTTVDSSLTHSELARLQATPTESNVHIAGSRSFVKRLARELKEANYPASTLMVYNIE